MKRIIFNTTTFLLSILLFSNVTYSQNNTKIDSLTRILLDSAHYYRDIQEYEKACSFYKEAYMVDSLNFTIVDKLTSCYLYFENYSLVIQLSNYAEKLDGSSPHPFYSRSCAYFEQKDYENTIAEINNMFKLSDIEEDVILQALYQRAISYKNLGKYKKAIEDFDSYIRLDSTNLHVFYLRGVFHHSFKNYVQSISDLDYYIQEFNKEKSYSYFHSLKVLGDALIKTDQINKAREVFKELNSCKRDDNKFLYDSYWYLGKIESYLGNIERSIEYFTYVIENKSTNDLTPDFLQKIYQGRARAYFILDEYEKSLLDFKKVNSDDYTEHDLLAMTTILIDSSPSDVLEVAKKGSSFNGPHQWFFELVLSDVFFDKKEYEKSLTHIVRSIELAEGNNDFNGEANDLGELYVKKAKLIYEVYERYDEVLSLLEKSSAILERPFSSYENYIHGASLLGTGKHEIALSYFDKVIESSSQEYLPEKYFFRGVCLAKNGDCQKAVPDLSTYISLENTINIDFSLLYRAHCFFEMDMYDQCIDDCKEGIALNDETLIDFYLLLGKAYSKTSDYSKSEYYIEKFMNSTNKKSIYEPEVTSYEAYYFRALNNYNVGEFLEAIEFIKEAQKFSSNERIEKILLHLLASSYFESKNYNKAIDCYTNYFSYNSQDNGSQNFIAYYNRGLSYFFMYEYEASISDLEVAINYAPNQEDLKNTKLKLAQVLTKNEDINSARGIYQELLKDSIDFNVLQEFVVFEINQGELENSVELLSIGAEESLKRNHGSAAIAYFTSAMIKMEMGDKNGMIEDINMALETDDYREGVETLYNSALSFRMMSLYNDSEFEKLVLKDAKRIIKEYPGDEMPYMITSLIHFRNKNFKKAMDVIKGYGKNTSSDTNVEFFKLLVYIYSQFSDKEGITEREMLLLERGEYKPFILLIKAVEKNQKEDFNSSCNLLDEFFMLVEGSQLRELKENNPLFKKLRTSKLNSNEKHSLFYSLIEETLYFNLGIETNEDIF